MILTFYDKNFIALQDNASLNVGEWELRRRAVDFDDFSATSEAFLEDINPTFVVLKDDRGRYKYAAFAGVAELTDDNQTSIQGSDLKTFHNNEILLGFPSYTEGNSVYEMFSLAIQTFYEQVVQDSFAVEYDLTDITNIQFSDLVPDTETGVYNLWDDIFVPYMKYYGLYMESCLDIANQKLVFTIGRANKYSKFVNLYEKDEKNFGKWISSVNETQYFIQTSSGLYTGEQFILNSKNEIGLASKVERDLFPIKKKIFYQEIDDEEGSKDFASAVSDAWEDCLETLVDSMYNENLELDVDDVELQRYSFDSFYDVYIKKGQLYKSLPLGEIYEDSKGEKSITLGYKQNDIVVYL